MGFLDQLKDTITDAGAKAQTKAKEVADTVSLKNQIHTEEKKQMELFVRLGKAYFEAHKDDENDAKVADITTIKASIEAIKNLNDQLSALKGTRVCANCGEEVDKDAVFCPKCGAKSEGSSTEN